MIIIIFDLAIIFFRAFIGPSLGGFLFDEVGFERASMFMLASHGLLVISIDSACNL